MKRSKDMEYRLIVRVRVSDNRTYSELRVKRLVEASLCGQFGGGAIACTCEEEADPAKRLINPITGNAKTEGK